MMEFRVQWLPLLLACFLPLAFITTYIIAVLTRHVTPIFPYISDTGTLVPESCIFGELLTLAALLTLFVGYIRFRHISAEYSGHVGCEIVLKINTAAFIIGLISSLGITMVGNFQETNVPVVHFIGAAMAFVGAFIYGVLQTVLSYRLLKTPVALPGNTPRLRAFRTALCVLNFFSVVVFIVFSTIAKVKYQKFLYWTDDKPGYAVHITAAVSEWATGIIFAVYYGTFYTEFKHFRVEPAKINFDNERTPLLNPMSKDPQEPSTKSSDT